MLASHGGVSSTGLEEAIDTIASAVLIVDAVGRIRAMNSGARSLAAQAVFRSGHDGVLEIGTADATRQVLAAIAHAAAAAARGERSPGSSIAFDVEVGLLELFVAPLRSQPYGVGGVTPVAMLVIGCAEEPESLEALTRAQYAVAERLSCGATIAETAADLGVSRETVRSHVKEVYRKLGIGSRAELARRVR